MSPQDSIRSVLEFKGGQIWSIHPDATVYEALERMAEKEIGCMPVLDESGKLAGLISERDYARKVILQGKHSRDTRVSEIMTLSVIYVTPSDTVEGCMRIMTNARVRHLPVLEGSRLAGIISIGDLVNWIITSQEEIITSQEEFIAHLRNYIAGSYPV
jgi:signal-transduction protein with cAMP-binding, CBS, and nucleotidyltransferase domain